MHQRAESELQALILKDKIVFMVAQIIKQKPGLDLVDMLRAAPVPLGPDGPAGSFFRDKLPNHKLDPEAAGQILLRFFTGETGYYKGAKDQMRFQFEHEEERQRNQAARSLSDAERTEADRIFLDEQRHQNHYRVDVIPTDVRRLVDMPLDTDRNTRAVVFSDNSVGNMPPWLELQHEIYHALQRDLVRVTSNLIAREGLANVTALQ